MRPKSRVAKATLFLYDRIGAFVPKGEREKWKEYAKTKDMTLNKLICVAVDEFMERNSSPT